MNDLYTLVIVGAGLSALSALKAGLVSKRALLLDYQECAGGFLQSALPAPGFESFHALVQSAAQIIHQASWLTPFLQATAVGLLPSFEKDRPHTLIIRRHAGTQEIQAQQVVIACGGLELTREQAQIPGPRPAGVMTPIQAHQLLNRGYLPGTRIVVHGCSQYARQTAERLAKAGLSVVLVGGASELVSPAPSGLSSSLTILPPAHLVALEGFPRLAQLTFRNADHLFTLPADTLIYGLGMQANTHWLKGSGLALTADGALEVNRHYQTSMPGIYAMGTVVSPSLDHAHSLQMGKEVAALLSGGSL